MKTKIDDTILEAINETKEKFHQKYGRHLSTEHILEVIDTQNEVVVVGLLKGFHIHLHRAFKFTNYSIDLIRTWYYRQKKIITDNNIWSDIPLEDELEELRQQRHRIISENEKAVSDTRNKPSVTLKELKDAPIDYNYNKRTIRISEDFINPNTNKV